MTPVVAIAERRPVLTASPAEVARILEAPIAMFLPDAAFEMVERTVGDWPLRYGAYDARRPPIWGATARILSQLGAVVSVATGATALEGKPGEAGGDIVVG